jgi:hypothetical protein
VKSVGRKLALDAIALVLYALAALPALTTIPIHEWLGIAAFVVLAVHLVSGLGEAWSMARSADRSKRAARWGNLVVDVLLLIVLSVCMVSGLLVSGTVLPTFGLFADGYYFWDPLHAASAKALLALLVVHLALHARWIANAVRHRK